jgi:hypothetical protein
VLVDVRGLGALVFDMRVIVAISTPFALISIALECRSVCGVTRLAVSDGQLAAAAAAYFEMATPTV